MSVSYSSSSPYYSTGKYGQFLDVMTPRPITKKADDVKYQIDRTYHLKPRILAYDLYGDPNLWWVFAARNPNTLKDPLFDFVTGTVIYLPAKSTLVSDLGL